MESQGAGRLPGMRDLFEEENRRNRRVGDGLQSFLSLYGYRTVDTPVVEPTDIFLRKSGGELASQMYTFVEPGGHQVSLRPEFTSQVIHLFLQEQRNQTTPVRWQYAGPVFRYSPGETRYGRQFTQVGAELVHRRRPKSWRWPAARWHRLVWGRSAWCWAMWARSTDCYDSSSCPSGRRTSCCTRWGSFAMVRPAWNRCELGLFDSPERQQGVDALSQHLAASEASQNESGDGSIGVRSTQEVLERLERKLQAADPDASGLENALAFTQALAGLKGAPKETLKTARRLAASHSLDASPLSSIEASLDAFALHDLKGVEVSVDLGLARDIAYYTGPVFEVWAGPGVGVRLAGGGRYDGLVKALGGSEDVPALGFACTLELVTNALSAEGSSDARSAKRVLVAPKSDGAVKAALQAAASLRLGGEVAAVSLNGVADRDGARAQGFEAIMLVDEDGTSERIWL